MHGSTDSLTCKTGACLLEWHKVNSCWYDDDDGDDDDNDDDYGDNNRSSSSDNNYYNNDDEVNVDVCFCMKEEEENIQ